MRKFVRLRMKIDLISAKKTIFGKIRLNFVLNLQACWRMWCVGGVFKAMPVRIGFLAFAIEKCDEANAVVQLRKSINSHPSPGELNQPGSEKLSSVSEPRRKSIQASPSSDKANLTHSGFIMAPSRLSRLTHRRGRVKAATLGRSLPHKLHAAPKPAARQSAFD